MACQPIANSGRKIICAMCLLKNSCALVTWRRTGPSASDVRTVERRFQHTVNPGSRFRHPINGAPDRPRVVRNLPGSSGARFLSRRTVAAIVCLAGVHAGGPVLTSDAATPTGEVSTRASGSAAALDGGFRVLGGGDAGPVGGTPGPGGGCAEDRAGLAGLLENDRTGVAQLDRGGRMLATDALPRR